MRHPSKSACRTGCLFAALLVAGCGDEVEITLHLASQSPCYQPASMIKSFAIRAIRPDPAPAVLLSEHCLAADVPATQEGIAAALGRRGYVVKDVDASQSTQVHVIAHAAQGCPTDSAALICLLSDPVSPSGERQEVRLVPICPGDGGWHVCVSLGKTPL